MIIGAVNDSIEACVAVELCGLDGTKLLVNAIIDTGFSGDLMLPEREIDALKFPLAGGGIAILATGDSVPFQVYIGTVIWDGAPIRVEVIPTSGESLVGMRLLRGLRLTIDVSEGGRVAIERLTGRSLSK
jgi:clan AA aspartic protease